MNGITGFRVIHNRALRVHASEKDRNHRGGCYK
jgi:hypothetical protein